METMKALPTKFLPAERGSAEEVAAERRSLESMPQLRVLLDSMPQFVLVLDARRQIVMVNRATREALSRTEDQLLGLRPGDLLGCVYARENGGCGTTEHCRVCGAARALLSVSRGRDDERDCRIVAAPPAPDRDLSVRAARLTHAGRVFTVFSATDRSGENRRRALERLFFHDALNTAGALSGLAELLPEADDSQFDGFCSLLRNASTALVDQLVAQRDLTRVENGEYALQAVPIAMKDLVSAAAKLVSAHPVAAGRTLCVVPGDETAAAVSDRGLLTRVVVNMLKNAVEAEPRGTTVTAGWDAPLGGGVEVWVRNPSVMPREVQLQVFQRSFSTKGEGRGLGTYSMRLLGERYLKGRVSFRSEPAFGTEFRLGLPARLSVPGQPGAAESSNL